MKELRASLGLFLALFVLTGFLYPMVVMGFAQGLFPFEAGGSLIKSNGVIIGSDLIGQNFTDPGYFHPRPSAAGAGYDASNSSGSNLALTSADLKKAVEERAAAYKLENRAEDIPVDLVTSSASGLDPDISDAAAHFQAPRVAAARHIGVAHVIELINQIEQAPMMGFLGEKRVNVLALNRALDQLAPR
jgi:K+-transporting ATPase ATPase C chain